MTRHVRVTMLRGVVFAGCAAALTWQLAFSVRTSAATEGSFEYSGDTGPGFWGQLSTEWAACNGQGGKQTPIDISRAAPDLALQPLRLDLKKTHVSLINNGHTIEQEYEPGSTLILGADVFDLLQFHFHTMSEHTLAGRRYPLEMHAVFKNARTGQLAVIGQLFDIVASDNAFLAKLVARLPEKKGQSVKTTTDINLAEGLTSTNGYYTYQGSLTTPPCSETVTWFLLRDVAQLSAGQWQSLQRVMGNNFRPLQPRSRDFFVSSR